MCIRAPRTRSPPAPPLGSRVTRGPSDDPRSSIVVDVHC